MKKLLICSIAAVLGLAGAAAPAGAGPPDRSETRPAVDFPDFERGLVIMVNTTRDAICTDAQLAAELATIEWFPVHGPAFFAYLDANDGDPTGFPGVFPPEEPPRPEGIASFSAKGKETGKGAIVFSETARNVHVEIWRQVENPPGVGPCTDTLGMTEPYAVGTGHAGSRDNDLFGSDTRGNSFGNWLNARLITSDGDHITYRSRFHINRRCHAPDDGPPACLIERSTLR